MPVLRSQCFPPVLVATCSAVLLDTILRPVHLVPIYGDDPVPTNSRFVIPFTCSGLIVSKHIDLHSHITDLSCYLQSTSDICG